MWVVWDLFICSWLEIKVFIDLQDLPSVFKRACQHWKILWGLFCSWPNLTALQCQTSFWAVNSQIAPEIKIILMAFMRKMLFSNINKGSIKKYLKKPWIYIKTFWNFMYRKVARTLLFLVIKSVTFKVTE